MAGRCSVLRGRRRGRRDEVFIGPDGIRKGLVAPVAVLADPYRHYLDLLALARLEVGDVADSTAYNSAGCILGRLVVKEDFDRAIPYRSRLRHMSGGIRRRSALHRGWYFDIICHSH